MPRNRNVTVWVVVAVMAVIAGLIALSYVISRSGDGHVTPALQTVNEADCRAAGGNWNPCGDACRTAEPGTPCIEVCVPYCECGGFAGFRCPQGSECTDYVPPGAADALGVCKKTNQ